MEEDWAEMVKRKEEELAKKKEDIQLAMLKKSEEELALKTEALRLAIHTSPKITPDKDNLAAGDASPKLLDHLNPTTTTLTITTLTTTALITTAGESGDNDRKVTADEETETPKEETSLLNKLLRSHLITTKNDIEVLRKDPKSPLYSVKSFEKLKLKKELLQGIYEMGFNAPSKIQETALPCLLAQEPVNMIAQSQSGTGKTAAFVLTMLSRINILNNYPQCICLTPTYELALQIGEVTEKMGRHMSGLNIGYAVRGTFVDRHASLPHHIIIGTPGTMVNWCISFRIVDMRKIEVFVLDEADVMIDKEGYLDQSIRLKKQLRNDCQLLLFSATYDDEVMRFANQIVSNPMVIRLKREEESLANIKQFCIHCKDEQEKFRALCNIYASISIGQTMIFCKTRRTTSWLTEMMATEGHAVALLSGELTVEQRAAVINRFKEGKERVLITTNVAARGIDVEHVTMVVNFDLPTDHLMRVDFETYLHRIGRTGRFGKKGLAINMIDSPNAFKMMKAIQAHFGREIHPLNADDLDEIEEKCGRH